MAHSMIEEKDIISALHRLNSAQWFDVLKYIDALSGEEGAEEDPDRLKTFSGMDLLNSGLIGMWADRPDIQNSTEFALKLRSQIETERIGRLDATA